MVYVIFHKGYPAAAAITAWTKHAFDRECPEWFVEAHDDWPEDRNFINLLQLEFEDLPDNTGGAGGFTVKQLMERIKE